MAFTQKNEDAVSPVIGVILMVAITVILAAVIAAFVFGMAGTVSKTKIVSVTVQRDSATKITGTFQGGQDANSITGIVWSGDITPQTQGATSGTTALPVGSITTPSLTTTKSSGSHVIGVGYFMDGTQQVIIDTKV